MIGSVNTGVTRVGIRDVAIVVALSALGLLLMYSNATDSEVNGSYLAIPAWLAITVPVAWRRIQPLQVSAVVLVALLLHIAAFGLLVRCGAIYPLVFVLAYTVGSLVPTRHDSLVGLGLVAATTVAMAAGDELGFGVIILGVIVPVMWVAGRFVRSRRRMNAELGVHTAELRETRDRRAKLEVATERARLSAELSDAVEKRLGDLAALAEAGAGTTDPNRPLRVIEKESRATLEQMRQIVGALRAEDGVVTTAPPPTLAHLDALLMRSKGENVRLEVEGTPRILPAGVELSAYRVVECLLDAMEDAPAVDVGVRFNDDALIVTVSGSMRRRRQANPAVQRARQRVQLHRGTLETSTSDGRARATAQLPVLAGT